MNKVYICIDLKSFYASVECRERGLDPLNTNLVVADESRTEKTICLAVTPTLKSYGLSGRCRLFEAVQKAKEVNYERRKKINYKKFIGKSCIDSELKNNPYLELDFIRAVPRMRLYMKYSTDIYNIYLKYIAPEDILVYSIDEVFCDVTAYLHTYKLTPEELVTKMITDVYNTTGITATAGIGTNMYLAKVAMDITAKHMEPNALGIRMAKLDEQSYKEKLWEHTPLTDFWRIGKGYATKLEKNGMHTMGDVALMSVKNEDKLFKLFGVGAEFLIDHAWGYEPCTIKDAKSYKPKNNSISSGQVLHRPYNYIKTRLIVQEMTDGLVLDLVRKHLVTDQIVLTIGYDVENLIDPNISREYDGPVTFDYLGRSVPKHAHGTIRIDHKTSSTRIIMKKVTELYEKIINPLLLVRRINISCAVENEDKTDKPLVKQMNLFIDYNDFNKENEMKCKDEKSERLVQRAILKIQDKYGKNSIFKGMDLEKGATARERNEEVGGHKG